MSKVDLKIADGIVVGLDYTLRLDDGEVIDSSADQEPLEFLQGSGQIIPGLEQALYDMEVGDRKQVVVDPADGYGVHDPNATELVPTNVFPADLKLNVGQRLNMRDQSGQVFEVHVLELRADGVLLDFNHPLAGETLFFDVTIATLRQATSEELTHGHSH
jgi:FKBP-type peptidyl-prolyl cis-trans isomerase SlyD